MYSITTTGMQKILINKVITYLLCIVILVLKIQIPAK